MKIIVLLLAIAVAYSAVAEVRPRGQWSATNSVMRDGREAYAITTVSFGTNGDFTILRSYVRPMGTPLLFGTKTTGIITDWQTNGFTAKEEVWPEIIHPSAKLIRRGEAAYGFEMKNDVLVLWDDHGTTNTLFREMKPEQAGAGYPPQGVGSPDP